MVALGIDIGTTTVSATVIDKESGKTLKSITKNSEAFIESKTGFNRIQSVDIIENIVLDTVKKLKNEFKDTVSIGVTGQMHGIVYVDKSGKAVSPLYTWQDKSGEQKAENGKTYVENIYELTGVSLPSGYGFATHYYNLINGLVPASAVTLCTIHDYIGMRLSGNTYVLMHSSDAASFGFFDSDNDCFKTDLLKKIGVNKEFLPKVCTEACINGYYEDIPVSVAIGDNQASFIGSVNDDNSLLVNIGTGSQISVVADKNIDFPSGEARPLYDDKSILVGSALCGGRAYACLEKFFRDIFTAYDGNTDKAYDFMNKIAEQSYKAKNMITVCTEFSGTRTDPDKRGSITGIDTENFTPSNLAYGVLVGCINELYGMYAEIKDFLPSAPQKLVGSGNGLRKSLLWRKIASDVFGMEIKIPKSTEEAAFGAALFSLTAAGKFKNLEEARKIIEYI